MRLAAGAAGDDDRRAASLARGWATLAEVTELLSARLADIPQRWESGRLSRAGLTAADVRGLVCAIFEASARRNECLSRIF